MNIPHDRKIREYVIYLRFAAYALKVWFLELPFYYECLITDDAQYS